MPTFKDENDRQNQLNSVVGEIKQKTKDVAIKKGIVVDDATDTILTVLDKIDNLKEKTLTTKNITTNGTFQAINDGADGYNEVTVDVPQPTCNLQEKTVTQNGDVLPDAGYQGMSKVTVNVSGGGGEDKLFKSLVDNTITDVTAKDLEGITKVKMRAFSCCDIRHIEIPSSVIEIGSYYTGNRAGGYSFAYVPNLEYIIFESETPAIIKGRDNFKDVSNYPIYVPDASFDLYRGASGWVEYANRIRPISLKP